MTVIRSVDLPQVRVEYDRAAPCREGFAVTKAGAVAVAFTMQRSAAWDLGGKTYSGKFRCGVSLPGENDQIWRRWSDTSEAVEFWLDEGWLRETFNLRELCTNVEPRISFNDPVLLAVASQFRRAMFSGCVDPLQFEELAIVSAHRLIPGAAPRRRGQRIAPLDDRRIRRIDELIHDHLSEPLTIAALARESGISLFHFAKRFRVCTGVSPYAYVVACRMNKAMQLLRAGWPVARVALAVGYSQLGHFRRQFRAHWGQHPGRLQSR